MIFKANRAPRVSSSQWIFPRNPDTLSLISTIATALYQKIELFHQTLQADNSPVNQEKISKSKFFSNCRDSQNYEAFAELRGINVEEIAKFLKMLNKEFKFSTECLVLTMVYINKFLLCSKIPLISGNWKNILLMSTLTAQRISDDSHAFASSLKNIPDFCIDDFSLMEIEYLSIINYSYKLEAREYTIQINYLQDISKTLDGYSWQMDNEKLENIIKRAEWLTEAENDYECEIYRSEAMYSIDFDEIDYN